MRKTAARLVITALLLTIAAWPWAAFAEGASKNIVNEKDLKYSYEDMETDLYQLADCYSDRISVMSLGRTADKRNIYCAVLGNPEAGKQIVVQAAIHAREYMNTQVIMEFLEQYAREYETGSYKGMKYSKLFDKVAVYIVPMVNPDGVTISQYGIQAIRDKGLRAKLKKMERSKGSCKYWKANARGVDLNRNFKRGWGKGIISKKPASESYPGKKALSEQESMALDGLFKHLPNVRACLSYHSMGEIIYWYVGQQGAMKKRSKQLADLAAKATGYKLVEPGKHYPGRGEFGNDCNMNREIPNLTIETGRSPCPLGREEFARIYKKNRTMIEKTAYLVK